MSESPTFETLIVEKKEKVAIVTINRPKALNALNTTVLKELELFFNSISKRSVQKVARCEARESKSTESVLNCTLEGDFDEANKADGTFSTDPKVVVLTGSGDKAFVAGADIKEIATLTRTSSQEFSLVGQKVFSMMESLPQVIIGAINGFALGGGLELALCCDFLVATSNAKFGLPEVSLGLIPGFGGTQRLSRLVGLSRAREMIFTANHIKAEEALRIGLVNRVVEGSLMEAALEIASKISSNGPNAIEHAKKAINKGFDLELSEALQIEAQEFSQLFEKPEQKEGVLAFIEKRKPLF